MWESYQLNFLMYKILTRLLTEEDALLARAFPVLRLLLKYFEGNPVNPDREVRMVDIEEDLETSPGELEVFVET